ncbi:MAG TPA: VOC family protein [Cyclobacteriaceae bacterium]|nr:VOC family protein [Cyclobacteriaceae bacterium]
MKQSIAHVALLVDDYDKAIAFYCGKLNFTLEEDTSLGNDKRWVLVKPPGSTGTSLLLARAVNEQQRQSIGNQSGGRVFLFLYTDHFQRDYQNLIDEGITIARPPVQEAYGTVAVFSDLYGNLWDLIEPTITR